MVIRPIVTVLTSKSYAIIKNYIFVYLSLLGLTKCLNYHWSVSEDSLCKRLKVCNIKVNHRSIYFIDLCIFIIISYLKTKKKIYERFLGHLPPPRDG